MPLEPAESPQRPFLSPKQDVSWACVPITALGLHLYRKPESPLDSTLSLEGSNGGMNVLVSPVLSAPRVTGIARAISKQGWEVWLRLDKDTARRLDDIAAMAPGAGYVVRLCRTSLPDLIKDAIIADGELGIIGLPTDHHARAVIRALHNPATGEEDPPDAPS
jgi:hypothetical protein